MAFGALAVETFSRVASFASSFIPANLGALEAFLLQLSQFLAILAFAAAHDRRQQIEPRAFGQRQNPVRHLADGLAFNRKAGGGGVRYTHPREQKPQIVVDLGNRAHGRARVLGGGLLFDGNRRRQALDMVDVRLLHQLQELARIGGQGLDIAALAFGIDGVEGQAGLARSRQTGQHRQRIAGNLHIDILEIVLARAANGDVLQHQLGFRAGRLAR